MAYKPSPRPVFDKPSHIPYAGVTRHLWGEEDAGFVDDWIYASTDKIHQLVFGLRPDMPHQRHALLSQSGRCQRTDLFPFRGTRSGRRAAVRTPI